MTTFAQSSQLNQTKVRTNRYHDAISLACVVGSIVFLFAICSFSTSPDTPTIELATMALPP
jgi:hypothetical protein